MNRCPVTSASVVSLDWFGRKIWSQRDGVTNAISMRSIGPVLACDHVAPPSLERNAYCLPPAAVPCADTRALEPIALARPAFSRPAPGPATPGGFASACARVQDLPPSTVLATAGVLFRDVSARNPRCASANDRPLLHNVAALSLWNTRSHVAAPSVV